MFNLARLLHKIIGILGAFAVSDVAFLEGLVGHCDNVALFRTAAGPIFRKTAEGA